MFWEIVADEVTLSVELPPNVSADINIHGQVFENITHNFKHVSNLHTKELEIAHK
ncbi:hypothetical protein D3C74_498330 [compost metagenome]